MSFRPGRDFASNFLKRISRSKQGGSGYCCQDSNGIQSPEPTQGRRELIPANHPPTSIGLPWYFHIHIHIHILNSLDLPGYSPTSTPNTLTNNKNTAEEWPQGWLSYACTYMCKCMYTHTHTHIILATSRKVMLRGASWRCITPAHFLLFASWSSMSLLHTLATMVPPASPCLLCQNELKSWTKINHLSWCFQCIFGSLWCRSSDAVWLPCCRMKE